MWKLNETPEGKEALKAVIIGSAAGSTDVKETTSREYVKAAEQIERARKLYPPPEPAKK